MHLHSTLALAALATTSLALTINRQTADPATQARAPRNVDRRGDASPAATKRGFAYNEASLVKSLLDSGAQGSWAYNWNSRDDGLDSSLEFVPMLWSDREDHASRWDANIREMLGKGAKNILSFNEPDIDGQAEMAPEAAVEAHLKYLNPHGEHARIGSPAVTNSEKDGEGTKWLDAFIPAAEAAGCQVDFCVAHWYGPAAGAQALVDHLKKVRETCGDRPVWLTEFAPEGGEAETVRFIEDALKALDDLEWLERYSYFMVDSKLTAGEAMSVEGKAYFASS